MDIRKLFNKFDFKIRDILFLSLVILVVGYASVTTVFNIAGDVSITKNLEQYNIYVGNVFVNGVNKFNSISDDMNSFTVTLTDTTSTIKYDVANNSNQYNISFGFSCAVDDETDNPLISTPDTIVTLPQSVTEDSITIVKTNDTATSVTCVIVSELEERDSSVDSNKTIFYAYDGETYDTGYKMISREDTTYGSLLELEKENYIFTGWYRDTEFTSLVTSDTAVTNNNDEILYGDFGGMVATYIYYDNSETGLDCDTLQCAIDELAKQ